MGEFLDTAEELHTNKGAQRAFAGIFRYYAQAETTHLVWYDGWGRLGGGAGGMGLNRLCIILHGFELHIGGNTCYCLFCITFSLSF